MLGDRLAILTDATIVEKALYQFSADKDLHGNALRIWVTGWRRRRDGVGSQTTRTSKRERYAMNENRVVHVRQKEEIDDPITEILRWGARRLIVRLTVPIPLPPRGRNGAARETTGTAVKRERFDIHQHITDQIIAAIECGVGEFQLPWHRSAGNIMRPVNIASRKTILPTADIHSLPDSALKGLRVAVC
jgi:N-terminal domain of anti-restriction factor ArdC